MDVFLLLTTIAFSASDLEAAAISLPRKQKKQIDATTLNAEENVESRNDHKSRYYSIFICILF